MYRLSKSLDLPANKKRSFRFVISLLVFGLFSHIAEARTDVYTFLSDRSAVIQTGGFAGVHETYSIEGQFQLTVDFGAGTALFEMVNATLTESSGFLYTQDLGELFNMTELVGTVVDDTTVNFEGKTADDTNTDTHIRLTYTDESVHLIGETVPPPNSADFFIYNLDAIAHRKFAGGTGEPNNPYQIATAEDLILLGDSPEDYDKHFILTADIDLDPNLPNRKVFDKAVIAPVIFSESRTGGILVNPFNGLFDGNGHTISHLIIEGSTYLGMFGKLSDGGIVSNLRLEAVDVNGTGIYVGCLVGFNKGSITTSNGTGTVNGDWRVGGLVGRNYYGSVSNCYSTVTVTGDHLIGGLVGYNEYGDITASYSTGMVIGSRNVGGLVGENNGSITTSFWDVEISGVLNMCGNQNTDATGCDDSFGETTAELQMAGTFIDAGWDFVDETENGTEDMWWIDEGNDYPRLWWEKSTGNAPVLIVEDFESYDNEVGNCIFEIWIATLDLPVNGAQVGHNEPPFVETVIVHGGFQSMPFYYYNTNGVVNSRAVRAFTHEQDWTVNEADTLSLWFRGTVDNSVDAFYITVWDSVGNRKTLFNPNQNAVVVDTWKPWLISLSDLTAAGVNTSCISSMHIGVGDKSKPSQNASGVLYIDDICLYRSTPEPEL